MVGRAKPSSALSLIMDQKIVFSEKLSKADTLILKNLEADIKEVSSSRPLPSNGHTIGEGNGHTKTANGSTPVPLFPTTCLWPRPC